jgi:hypothetical protein
MLYPFAFNADKVLGGSGNTVTHNYAAVFGCNIVTNQAKAFHANSFVAQDMPDETGLPYPTGTLYYCSTTCAVFRQP